MATRTLIGRPELYSRSYERSFQHPTQNYGDARTAEGFNRGFPQRSEAPMRQALPPQEAYNRYPQSFGRSQQFENRQPFNEFQASSLLRPPGTVRPAILWLGDCRTNHGTPTLPDRGWAMSALRRRTACLRTAIEGVTAAETTTHSAAAKSLNRRGRAASTCSAGRTTPTGMAARRRRHTATVVVTPVGAVPAAGRLPRKAILAAATPAAVVIPAGTSTPPAVTIEGFSI